MLSPSDSEAKSSRLLMPLMWFVLATFLYHWERFKGPLFDAGLMLGSLGFIAWLGRRNNVNCDRLSTGLICFHTGISLLACELFKNVADKDLMTVFGLALCAQFTFGAAAWAWRMRGKKSLSFNIWLIHFAFYALSVIILIVITTQWCDYHYDSYWYYGSPNNGLFDAGSGLAVIGFLMICYELNKRRAVRSSVVPAEVKPEAVSKS